MLQKWCVVLTDCAFGSVGEIPFIKHRRIVTSLVRVDVAQRAAGAQKQDVYKHWLFDPLFKEDGLVMDSETSLPDVYSYNLVCLPSRRRRLDVLLSEIFILHLRCEALVFQCSDP